MNAIDSAAPSASALRGRGVGTLVCAGFAAFWAISSQPEWPTALVTPGFVAIALITAALIGAGIALIRYSRRLPRAVDTPSGPPRRTGLHFTVIFAAEIIALNIAAYVLTEYHVQQYLIPAIATIVGLHFFPLAQLFRAPRYHLTASLMTLAGIGGAVAIACSLPSDPVIAIVDVACAIVLWVTGFTSYVSTMRSIR
jgi:hypothetical protein